MRARYSAYALGDVPFIIATTDPGGPQAEPDRRRWAEQVAAFCRTTRFLGLEVRAASTAPDGERGVVSFFARLERGGEDTSFGERSQFVRRGGRWLYHAGEPLPERGPRG